LLLQTGQMSSRGLVAVGSVGGLGRDIFERLLWRGELGRRGVLGEGDEAVVLRWWRG
jgi:hypothetical protein